MEEGRSEIFFLIGPACDGSFGVVEYERKGSRLSWGSCGDSWGDSWGESDEIFWSICSSSLTCLTCLRWSIMASSLRCSLLSCCSSCSTICICTLVCAVLLSSRTWHLNYKRWSTTTSPPPPLTVSNVGKTPELSGSEHRNQPTYKPRGCTGDAPWHSHSSVPGPAHKYFIKFSFYGSQLPPPPSTFNEWLRTTVVYS